jgi:outer membrane protein assembly factor BamB
MTPYPFHGEHMLRIDPATQTIELTYERPTPENYWDVDHYTLCGDKLIVGFNYMYDDVKPLVAYDIASPTISWQLPFVEVTGEIACDANAGVIYVPTNSYLYALDVTDGSEVWKHLVYAPILSPSIANGIVYYLSDTNMYALNQTNGDQLFHYPLGFEADGTTQVAIADGMVYFSGNGGDCDLYALALPGPRQFLPLIVR